MPGAENGGKKTRVEFHVEAKNDSRIGADIRYAVGQLYICAQS